MDASLSERGVLIAWAVVAAIAIGWQLGGYPLLDADEGRNGEVGREMAATNDYVMPRLDGLPYLDKPIVYFAAEAATMEITGPTEFAARFPAWLFTIATAVLLAWFARRESLDAPLTAIVFLSMPLTIAFARTVIFDSALSFCITLALIAFYLERPTLAWAAMALGVITKGPVAIAVPMMIAIPFASWRRRFRHLVSIAGFVVFVLIIAPWVWAVSREIPDFLHYVVVTETAQRLTTGALKRTGPPWYFIPYLIGGAFPWVLALFGKRLPATDHRPPWLDRYLLLWIAVPFIFFSISQSKRPQYVLPLMAPIALYVARRTNPGKAAAIVTALFGALLLGAIPFVQLQYGRDAAIVIGICALIFGVIAAFTRGAIAWIALSIPMLTIPIATNSTMNALALRRSTKSLIAQMRPYINADTEIVGLEAFTGSMAFYLQRTIVLVTPDAEELTSNYIIRHYGAFASNLRSTVRPMSWLPVAFDRQRPRLIIVRDSDRRNRTIVEQHGGRLVATGAHFVTYTMPR
ncbi:MAG: glycosyltransferase family 39 protein [Acidobacteriota bacterium]|nr:glycosyltransferase family 39 protein [Acidobacteriota bacterium]